MRELTNLESVLLAQLWFMGESTPHEVRRAFAGSSSAKYSDSAGSIYPTLRRLESFGLAESRADRRGRQARRLYRITAAGLKEITRWLYTMEPEETFPDDPIRTRFQYMGLLDRESQLNWLDEADATLERQAQIVREEYSRPAMITQIDQLVLAEIQDTIELRRERLRAAKRLIRRKGRLTRET